MNLPERIEHDGTGCPLPVGTRVRVWIRCGDCEDVRITPRSHSPGDRRAMNMWRWAVNGREPCWSLSDVTHYQIIGVPDEELYPVAQEELHA